MCLRQQDGKYISCLLLLILIPQRSETGGSLAGVGSPGWQTCVKGWIYFCACSLSWETFCSFFSWLLPPLCPTSPLSAADEISPSAPKPYIHESLPVKEALQVVLFCFISSTVHWSGRKPALLPSGETTRQSFQHAQSPLREEERAAERQCHSFLPCQQHFIVLEAADGLERIVVTLLTTSLTLTSFSRNLNNCLLPWAYWTWFVLQVGKQLWISSLDELTCLHNTADAAERGYNMCQILLGLQAK